MCTVFSGNYQFLVTKVAWLEMAVSSHVEAKYGKGWRWQREPLKTLIPEGKNRIRFARRFVWWNFNPQAPSKCTVFFETLARLDKRKGHIRSLNENPSVFLELFKYIIWPYWKVCSNRLTGVSVNFTGLVDRSLVLHLLDLTFSSAMM